MIHAYPTHGSYRLFLVYVAAIYSMFCCDFFNPVEKSKESRQVHDHFCATFFWSKSRKLKKWPEISGLLVLEVSVPTPFKMSRDAVR